MFNNVDGELAVAIAQGIGVTPPVSSGGSGVTASSPAVSQANTVKCAATRKIGVLLENGYNSAELMQVLEAMKSAGVTAEIISKNLGLIASVDGKQIQADKNYLNSGSIHYDAVYIPGGQESVSSLMQQGDSLHFINEAFKHAKPIGATNEAVNLLTVSQIPGVSTAGATGQGQVVSELGVVTERGSSDMANFNQAFTAAIAEHRHWGRSQVKDMIPA